MTALYHAHSGLRYLVLLVGLLAALYLAYAFFARRPVDRASRVLTSAFVGLLDLQILLGIVLVIAGVFYPRLIGHLVTMLLAAAVAHGAAVAGKRATEARRAHGVRLLGVIVTLVLIVAGIQAIGRSVLGSGAPTLGG